MNAQADLFVDHPPAPGPREIVLDLRDERFWGPIFDMSTGQPIRNVVGSKCGRFTIVTASNGYMSVAFKRNPAGDRWNPPTCLGGFKSIDLARQAAFDYAEANP